MGFLRNTQLEILRILRENEGIFVSGAALAERFAISRPGVWKHIQKLKEMGYDIVSLSRRGYKLIGSPDSLTLEQIVPDLTTRWLGHA